MSYYDEMRDLAEREGPFDDPEEDKLRDICMREYKSCRWCMYFNPDEEDARQSVKEKRICDVCDEQKEVDPDHCCDDWYPCDEVDDLIDEDVREAAAEEREQEHLRNWWLWM